MKYIYIHKYRGVNIDQIAMCYISIDSLERALQNNEIFFFKFVFKILVESLNIYTNSEAWILIKVQHVIYQWIRLDKLCKQMESFLKFRISFQIICRKPENIQRIIRLGLCKRGIFFWSARVLVSHGWLAYDTLMSQGVDISLYFTGSRLLSLSCIPQAVVWWEVWITSVASRRFATAMMCGSTSRATI